MEVPDTWRCSLASFFVTFQLLRRPFVVSFFQCFAGSMAIEFCCHSNVGDGSSISAFGMELLVDFLVFVHVESWCWYEGRARTDRVVERGKPTFGLEIGA